MNFDKFFEEDNEDQGFSFDYKRYLHGIYKRKWISIGIFLAVLIPLLLFVNSQPPEYEAYTWIQFKNYDPDRIRSLNNSRLIKLTSRTFAEKVVAELGLAGDLMKDDKKDGLMRQKVFAKFITSQDPEAGKYLLTFLDSSFIMFRVSRDEKNRKKISSGIISDLTDKDYSINGFTFRLSPEFSGTREEIMFKVNRFRNTVSWFRSHVRTSMGQGGTMMMIRMVYDNPVIVAQMVNSLADIFIEESISFERKNADDYRINIQNMLKTAKAKLDEDQRKLEQYQRTFTISLDVDVQNKISKLSNLQNEKNDLELNKNRVADLIGNMDRYGKTVITPGQEDSEIRFIYSQIVKNKLFEGDVAFGVLAQELSKEIRERQNLLDKSLNFSHSLVVDIDRRIVAIQVKILENSQRVIKNVENNLFRIDRQIMSISRDIDNLPTEKRTLANLQGEVGISQKIYNNYFLKSSELDINETVETEEIEILDPALTPEFPVNRGKKRNAAMGGVFALFLALGMAIFLEFMDKSVKSPADIKKYLKLDVIGTIPRVDFENENELKDADKLKQFDSQLVTYDYSPTPISEAYRALRTKIVYSKKTGKIRTFVVSSFAPGDGKSFTSANLAITLAQHKTNTLLIDSDLRRGVLHNTFGIKKEPGISNLLMGMIKFDDIVQETYVPNLSIVSCGSMMPNPSELLGSVYLKQFIEEAKSRFDTVIFDSPPLNAATDAVVLGTQLDGVVLIVRADITNRNVAKQKLDLFENVPANILGVILNGANTELAHDGYSYYHY